MKLAALWSRWFPKDALRGRVDGVVDGRLQGWALDGRSPGRPLRLRIEAGDTVVRTVADRYRADVHAAGLGDGACGFSVSLAHLPSAGGYRVVVDDDGREIAGGSAAGGATPAPALAYDDSARLFRLDRGRADRGLSGCCIDRAAPRRRCRLALMAGDRTLAETVAIHYRADLDDGVGDPLHGFTFAAVNTDGPLRIVDLADGSTLARQVRRRRRQDWCRPPLAVADRPRPG